MDGRACFFVSVSRVCVLWGAFPHLLMWVSMAASPESEGVGVSVLFAACGFLFVAQAGMGVRWVCGKGFIH